MPRWSRTRRQAARQQLDKATRPGTALAPISTTSAAGIVPADLAAAQRQAFNAGMLQAAQLPRDLTPASFGPGTPMAPTPVDPSRPDTGRPEPRQYEYDVSYNLPGVSGKLVPWKTLRDAADTGLVRAMIEKKKAQLGGLDWDITISDRALDNATADSPDKPRSEIEKDLRNRLQPHITRACAFWEKPDPDEGMNFAEWLGLLLEESLVLDALAIYPRRTNGGEPWGLEILDGATIKPLINSRGRRPVPPYPAYQQILQGLPRSEFTATVDEQGQIPNGYSADQMIYNRRVVRPWTRYGFSPVERSLQEIGLYLRRMGWIQAEHTDGARPDTFGEIDKDAAISPEELRVYEAALNGDLAGDNRTRHLIKLMPPGAKISQTRSTDERYKPDYDLHIIKLLAAHFGLTITELGFSEAKGLGSSGFHEGQTDVGYRTGILPDTRWLTDLFNEIGRSFLDLPPELTFKFLGLDDEDEAATDAVVQAQVFSGRITLNEGRDRQGKDRYDIDEANEPMIVSGRSIVFLKDQLAQQEEQRQLGIAGMQAAAQAAESDPNAEDPENSVGPGQSGPGQPGAATAGTPRPAKPANPANKPANAAKADELDQFARFLEKGERSRDFAFTKVDSADSWNAMARGDAAETVKRAREAAARLRGAGGRAQRPPGAPEPAAEGVAGVPRTSGAAGPAVVVYRPGC